ncbi:MAG: nitroreductase family protein [Candidatus Heimdallarchaeota archaeon]
MKYSRPIDQIIQQRYSARTLNGKPIKPKKMLQIEESLQPKKGPFGCTVRFEFIDSHNTLKGQKVKIGTYGLVKGTRYFIVGIMNKNSLNFTDFGYVFEEMILKATNLQLGTVWMGGSFNSELITNLLDLPDDEVIPAITPVGYIAQRKSLREKIISFSISSRKRKPWESMFFDTDFETSIQRDNAALYDLPLEMIRLAPSAKNLQPWRILRKDNNFHFYTKIGNSRSRYPYIDIGIAMCHFELTAKEQKLAGKWFVENPNIKTQPDDFEYITSWIAK